MVGLISFTESESLQEYRYNAYIFPIKLLHVNVIGYRVEINLRQPLKDLIEIEIIQSNEKKSVFELTWYIF